MRICFFLFFAWGLFSCQSTESNQSVTESNQENAAKKALDAFFEEVNPVKIHFFSSMNPDVTPEEYPYVGKQIDGASQSLFKNVVAGNAPIFGSYRTEYGGYYIVRSDGVGSGDLLLAWWDEASKHLKKVSDLASINCSEGLCMNKNSWLADLDDNRTLELIVRVTETYDDGTITNETFEVFTDNGKGGFDPASAELTSLAIKDNYVMAE